MKDCIAAAAFLVWAQSGHGSWYRLHVPSWIFVRSLKISSMRSTVEVVVYLCILPRIRSWTSLAVLQGAMDGGVFLSGFVCLDGLVDGMV